MNTTVVKFGGSSLASAQQIRKAADIILADPNRRYVVVSAPGKRNSADTKVTDLLYECFDEAKAGKDFEPALAKIEARFAEIIHELGIEFDLNFEIERIRRHLSADKRSRDYMASRGEYLNAKIIAAFLKFDFCDAAQMIVFNENGQFDAEATNQRTLMRLGALSHVVIPGFYGSLPDGSIKTFSRGGSDITGSIVARAIYAGLYENWTDVSGMMAADPRIVPNPRVIEYITYRELRELAYMGASVMHEDAVFPARQSGIPIKIRNTNEPEDPGTMIVAALPEDCKKQVVTGIAGKKGFCSLVVEKSMMNGEVGFGAKLLNVFTKHGVSIEHCPTGIDTMSAVVSSAEFLPVKDKIFSEIIGSLQPDMIEVEDKLAILAVVGAGMNNAVGTAASIFSALAQSGIDIRMIDQGSDGMNIIVGVGEYDFEKALVSIYRAVIEGK